MMVNKVQYRRAHVGDIEDLVKYRTRFLNEAKTHSENETKTLEVALKKYFTWATSSNEFIGWLAEYEGKLVGTSGLVIWQIPGRYGFLSGKNGYIHNMYTIPKMRKQGIATYLLNKLILDAKAMGVERLHLHAREAGDSLYRKKGFNEQQNPELILRLT